jgi:hypothetical protein
MTTSLQRFVNNKPLITIVTATTGNISLKRTISSVLSQDYQNIQYLIFIDGDENLRKEKAFEILADYKKNIDVVLLPYATGKDNYNGHKIYGAAPFFAKGDFLCFLDEDNFFDTNHVSSNMDNILKNNLDWSYSLRKIFDVSGNFICNDDCESLGKWPTCISSDDFLIDVNCYFLSKHVALKISSFWYNNKRNIDRIICKVLLNNFKNFNTTYKYTVNYTAESTKDSVKKEFFIKGNEKIKMKYFLTGRPWIPGEEYIDN